MKRIKFYMSIILVICILVSTPCLALASSIMWVMNPVSGVTGSIYASNPHGFIIQDYDWENGHSTTALVNDQGVVIPQSDKNFTYVDETGLIEFYVYDENGSAGGVMDVSGNIVFPASKDRSIYVLNENRFVCVTSIDNETVCGIIDRNGNEIVPFNYSDMQWWGVVVAYGKDDNSVTVIDRDGNILATYCDPENNTEICTLPADDRYLMITGSDKTQTRIIHTNGTEIAVIESLYLYPISSTVLSGIEYYDGGLKQYYYDYDGNLLNGEDQKDWNGNNGVSYSYSDNEESAYTIEFVDGCDCLKDRDGNIVYRNPDVDVVNVYKDTFIKVTNDDYETYGILDLNGNEIVPLGMYSSISYCEPLDLFAFEKEGQISIGKIQTITVNVNGSNVEFDQEPIIKDGRTLVPMRAIFEALGATVEWDGETRTVTSIFSNITVQLTIGSNIMRVNDTDVILDVPAEILNGRTIVPVRAISEAFGCNVGWNGDTKTVTIAK